MKCRSILFRFGKFSFCFTNQLILQNIDYDMNSYRNCLRYVNYYVWRTGVKRFKSKHNFMKSLTLYFHNVKMKTRTDWNNACKQAT